MSYEYFDDEGHQIEHSNLMEAVQDLNVYLIAVTNTLGRKEYFRSGAGWKEAEQF